MSDIKTKWTVGRAGGHMERGHKLAIICDVAWTACATAARWILNDEKKMKKAYVTLYFMLPYCGAQLSINENAWTNYKILPYLTDDINLFRVSLINDFGVLIITTSFQIVLEILYGFGFILYFIYIFFCSFLRCPTNKEENPQKNQLWSQQQQVSPRCFQSTKQSQWIAGLQS